MPAVSAKPARSVFACAECGHESPKWLGRCPGCASWNSFAEAQHQASARTRVATTPVALADLADEDAARTPTGLPEFDRVLGGGIVAGGLLLIGGDPGIGKSTLLLQAAGMLAAAGRVVLYLEGERFSAYRLLRGLKNRFGSTDEVGVFEMTGAGLRAVDDPSQLFTAARARDCVGSVVTPVVEGSRPVLVEVQALTSPTIAPAPRRTANGLDFNRLLLVSAVLSRRLGESLASQDVIASVAG